MQDINIVHESQFAHLLKSSMISVLTEMEENKGSAMGNVAVACGLERIIQRNRR